MFADPLRAHDCAPVTDGASAVIIAADDRARSVSERPAWITGLQHRVDAQTFGLRDLTNSDSTAAAAAALDLDGIDTAELHAPFSHQELVLRNAIGLADDVTVNPSGGALCGNPMFAAGLNRIGEAARRISSGTSDRALAHATSGPALQQNLLCTLSSTSTGGSN
jgi:acetyl-CoA acetyltransferase